MLTISIAITALVLVLSLLLRLASAFRLTIPILYAIIAPTLFHNWFTANTSLATTVGWILLGFSMLTWVISCIKRIRELMQSRREDLAALAVFERRMRLADANGASSISTVGLYRD